MARKWLIRFVIVTAAVLAAFAACTIKVDPPPVEVQKVEIDCIIIELPSGETQLHCPDSGASDASDASHEE